MPSLEPVCCQISEPSNCLVSSRRLSGLYRQKAIVEMRRATFTPLQSNSRK